MDILQIVADAVDGVRQLPYNLSLTRLVDGESTYTLTYPDRAEPLTFDDIDAAYAHIGQRKSALIARAAIEAMQRPTPAMKEAAAAITGNYDIAHEAYAQAMAAALRQADAALEALS